MNKKLKIHLKFWRKKSSIKVKQRKKFEFGVNQRKKFKFGVRRKKSVTFNKILEKNLSWSSLKGLIWTEPIELKFKYSESLSGAFKIPDKICNFEDCLRVFAKISLKKCKKFFLHYCADFY